MVRTYFSQVVYRSDDEGSSWSQGGTVSPMYVARIVRCQLEVEGTQGLHTGRQQRRGQSHHFDGVIASWPVELEVAVAWTHTPFPQTHASPFAEHHTCTICLL